MQVTLVQSKALLSLDEKAWITHNLLESYAGIWGKANNFSIHSVSKALDHERTRLIEFLQTFHSQEYISALLGTNSSRNESDDEPGNDEEDEDDDDEFGLEYDCPWTEDLPDYILNFTKCVQELLNLICTKAPSSVDGQRQVYLFPEGGRHHAGRSRASGFCHVNDIVLLVTNFLASSGGFGGPVVIVDLDVHRGNGTSDALQYVNRFNPCNGKEDRLLVFDIYGKAPGFFPDHCESNRQFKSSSSSSPICNIPIASSDPFPRHSIMTAVSNIASTLARYPCIPLLILVGGLDLLQGDPIGSDRLAKGCNRFGVTPSDLAHLIRDQFLANENLNYERAVWLGAGGYQPTRVASTVTFVVSKLLGLEEIEDIPSDSVVLPYFKHCAYELDLGDNNSNDESTDNVEVKVGGNSCSIIIKNFMTE